VELRVARERDEDEAPRHFEGVLLKTPVRVAGWVVGCCSTLGGIVLMVKMQGSVVELVGAAGAAAGVIALFLLVRCRRFETVLTEQWLMAGAGPLSHRVPRQLMGQARVRAATVWRRLYADREVVVEVPAGSRRVVLPSAEPEELIGELATDPRQ
jgi:hypothetical protein